MPVIGVLTLEIWIESSHSLKDKRQVIRSLKDRMREKFNVSVAEIEGLDSWQNSVDRGCHGGERQDLCRESAASRGIARFAPSRWGALREVASSGCNRRSHKFIRSLARAS